MDCVCARRQMILWGAVTLCMLVLPAGVSTATIYDFKNDGGEYNGTILGQNPLFVPGGVRSMPEFNNLYNPANNPKILDHFEVGASDRASFRTQTGSYFSWENFSPAIPTWVNAREGYKFAAGSALGGDYNGAAAGEKILFRAYSFPIGSGLQTEMNNLPFVAEMTAVAPTNGATVSFRFDSLPADARSFAAFRVTESGEYLASPNGFNTVKLDLTTVADVNPPTFPHSPTIFDFADVGVSYPLGAYTTTDGGEEGLNKVNLAHDSSHGLHDEEFVIGHPVTDPPTSFGIGGSSTAGYPDRYLTLRGTEDRVNFWVNAKEGFMFPQDAAIGVGQYNPNFTKAENGGVGVEVIIRAYAEPIETGSFTELAGLTLVGEAMGVGEGVFNTPPALELMANARSFTVHTGDGNGNFKSYFSTVTNSYAWTTLNQIIVDTVPDSEVGLPGDYNGDNVVDAADYTIYRDSVGQSTLTNRGPGISGPVGAADYNFWKSQFGAGGGSGALGAASVPEPSTLMMFVAAAFAATRLSRRKFVRAV